MPDITGEALDRLVTIEAKNRGMPHGILAPLYNAAREAHGGRPISMLAAESLKSAVGKGDVVLIMTGAGYEPVMPEGESDGPPGAAALARILHRGLGAVPVYVCEECHTRPIVASSEALGVMVKDFKHARDRHLGAAIACAPNDQGAVEAWEKKLFSEMKPKAVVSVERLGPGAGGVIHNATGQPLQGPNNSVDIEVIDISGVIEKAKAAGAPTIGIGDHGNELGFGIIRDVVAKTMPKGDQSCTTTGTDILFPCMMSNWGAYAIEAALAWLLQRPELMHSPADEERQLRACLNAGGLEAMYCTTDFMVDGLEGETSMACVQILRNIVRKNLEAKSRGVAH